MGTRDFCKPKHSGDKTPQSCQWELHCLVLAGSVLTGERVYQTLEDNKVTMTMGVPTLYASLFEYMKSTDRQLHHLKLAFAGGSALPAKLLHAYQR